MAGAGMRLKSIKLVGFKSFVDATTVPFPTNMTAIVGPNGCGKSNIIDAVRWVMGESSARYLRGESMTDVIFNGSTGRQPVGQASIELLFDNSEGKLGGEHGKFAELAIKRKVTRDGLSQYYLNGAKCRRRDVTDIFLGTGMGPRSYAIIEQGMISRLIESKPEELRVYLEEAAGISKYKERRKETENRMKRTEENLERLSDIRDELDKQLQHLKRQARAAEKYAEYKAEERLTQARLYALQWSALNQKSETQLRSIEEYEQGVEALVFDKATNEAAHESMRTQLEEKQAAFNKQQARYYEAGAELARIEQHLRYQKQRLSEQSTELAQLHEEFAALKAKEAHDRERMAQIQDVLEALAPEIELLEEQLAQQADTLEQYEQEMRAWQEEWERYNAQSATLRHNAESAQSAIQQAETRIKQLQTKAATIEQEEAQLAEQVEGSEHTESLEQKILVEEQLQEVELDINTRRDAIQRLRAELESTQQRRARAVAELSERKAVLASLRTLQEGALGQSLEQLERELQAQGVHTSRVIERAQVAAGWEAAVEHVLGDWLHGLVVEDDRLAWESVAAQSMQKIELVRDSGQQSLVVDGGPQQSLAQLVSGIDALVPWLSQIFAVDADEEAFALRDRLQAGQSVIARSGLWLTPSWLRAPQKAEQSDSMLLRQEQMHRLEMQIPGFEETLAELECALVRDADGLREQEQALQYAMTRQKQLHQELNLLASKLSAEQARQSQIRLRMERTARDAQELKLQLEQEHEMLEIARAKWETAMAELNLQVESKEALLARKERIQQNLEQLRSRQRVLQEQAHQGRLRQQMQLGEQRMLQQSLSNIEQARNQLLRRQTTLESGDRVDEAALLELEGQLEGLLETRMVDEEKLAAARTEMDQVAQAIRQKEMARHQLDARLQERRAALENLRMSQQALRINMENLVRAVEQDHFDLTQLLSEMPEALNVEALQQQLTGLADKVQRLGPINLAAIDEYQTQSERKDYLDRQHADLMDALETLQNAIRKIDRETRTKFKETFDQVNDGLQRLFPKIFGGGNASLSLTDDDLLETGVSILARPPGKKNATIHLLSGGEKALTALALIFAIFELNPAPFCMLDEVDAPLDDANVGRFANLVKDMSKTVQFIYISHNKVSMEKADQLMGVTMHEPGVSRLVSVNVEEATALVEV